MRKILAILLFALSLQVMAQYPCVNDIVTRPDSAVNNQQSAMNFDNQYFTNSFNWYDANFNSFNFIPYENMGDPFNLISSSSGLPFLNPFDINSIPFEEQKFFYPPGIGVQEVDMYPEDGWELVSINLGYAPDGTILSGNPHTEIPYILLYNKYRGILRLFAKTFNGITNNPQNGVKVTLEFNETNAAADKGFSSLFMLNNNIAQPLDEDTKIVRVVSMANHPNNWQKWFHVDYEVAYDPCVCYFRSDLIFKFEFITSATVNLAGRSVSVEQDLYTNSTNSVNYDKDFLTSIYDNPTNATLEAGSIIYATMDAMVDDYLAKLNAIEAYNNDPKIKVYKLLFSLYKAVKSDGVKIAAALLTSGTSTLLTQVGPELITLGVIDNFSITGDTVSVNGKALNGQIKNLVSKGFDKLTTKLEDLIPDKPASPVMPSAIFTEMSLTGTINSTFAYQGPRIMNPGTYNSFSINSASSGFSPSTQVDNFTYPVYNEALGLFALLRKPTLNHFLGHTTTYLDTFFVANDYFLIPIGLGIYDTVFRPHYTVEYDYKSIYQLQGGLQYVINPALDVNFNNSTIDASFVYETDIVAATIQSPNITHPQPDDLYNLYDNVGSIDTFDYSTPLLPLECVSDMVFGVGNNYGISANSTQIGFIENYANDPVPGKLFLRLALDLEFNQIGRDGQPIRMTQILTYPVNVIEDTMDFSSPSDFNLSDIPENIYLTQTHFTDDTTIYAWNNVFITDSISADSNVVVNIQAGNQVIFGAEGTIIPPTGTGEINLSINSLTPCDDPIPVQQNFSVDAFCNSNDYRAKFVAPGYRLPQTSSNDGITEIDLTARINSNSHFYSLSSKNITDQKQNFTMYDMTGKVLLQNSYLPNGIDLENYSVGMYILEFSTENGIARKKIMRN